MRLAVVGSGAVGGYFGGRLAEAGIDVGFLARGGHLAAIRDQGLRVSSVDGDFVVRPARVSDDPSDLGESDVVLVCVKAWQVTETAEALGPLVGPSTYFVPLQNGIEAPEQLARVFGPARVLGGLCRLLVFLDGPGRIRHAGVAPYVAFGEMDGRVSSRAERLREAFARTRGVTVEIPPDIRVAMWSKFLFIAALSGVGALIRAPIGVIRSQLETRALLLGALEEIHAVAAGAGVTLPVDSVPRTMAYIDTLPPDGTASMQRDILQGRPSELDAQTGTVVRLGDKLGIPVPVHRLMYAALVSLERRARGSLDFPA